MPGGDRTGPWGGGPRTGRAMGYCSGSEMPGSAYGGGRGRRGGQGQGFGRGYWCRDGRGRGFYGAAAPAPVRVSMEDEVGYLQDLKDSIERELEAVKKRLAALSKTEEQG